MTCRDLIVYILTNGLEDEPVFKDGKFVGFMTKEEAAVKLNTGIATIEALVGRDMLEGIQVNETVYIAANSCLLSECKRKE